MTCSDLAHLAAFLDGELSTNETREVSAHVDGCARCQTLVTRLRNIVTALPEAFSVPARPGFSAAVLRRAAGPKRRLWPALTLAMAGCLALAIFLPREGEFQARGGSEVNEDKGLGFDAFASMPGQSPIRLEENAEVVRGSGFSFVIRNRSRSERWLMLFALDSQGQVHWFYPAYTDASSAPVSVHLEAMPEVVALADGVTPDSPALGDLMIVGLFSSQPVAVPAIEALLARDGLKALAAKGDILKRLRVRLTSRHSGERP